jgi:hypothetical protein
MVSDLDIWRSANLLIRQMVLTLRSLLRNERMSDELLAAGDVEGQLVWKRILAAVKSWGAEPSAGDIAH